MNTASPGSSRTGSLRHGDSRLSWLLPDHVQPGPRSVAENPNPSCATMLDQGAGVIAPAAAWIVITYSRPPSAKPPRPLASSSPRSGGPSIDWSPSYGSCAVRDTWGGGSYGNCGRDSC